MFIQFWDNKSETFFNVNDVMWFRLSATKINGRRAEAWEICFSDYKRENLLISKNRFSVELVEE